MRKSIMTINQLSQLLKKSLSWVLGLLITPLLFTACTEEIQEVKVDPVLASQSKVLTIATPEKWIHIKGEETSSQRRATDAAGVDRGRFNITLKYVSEVTDRQVEVFEQAAARWERIIIKDVPSFTGTLPSGFAGLPPVLDNETLDDVIIEVDLSPIDGPGRILGRAGPRFVRTSDFLTLSGLMQFDSEDLDFLDQLDLFEEVIVHEMGHVLGVGTLWNVAPFGFPRTLLEGTAVAPFFSGKQANTFWNAEGGTGELPVQGLVGGVIRPGTSFSHWDEDILDNELMTGFLNLGENPLSRITAGSMRDLGYGAAMVGESYDLPKGTAGVQINDDAAAANEGQSLHIAEMEELLLPIGSVEVK